MSNFRIKGAAAYASKAPFASTANNGTEDSPKSTIMGMTAAGNKVIGPGVWNEAPTNGPLHADQPAAVILDGVDKTATMGSNTAGGHTDLVFTRFARVIPSSAISYLSVRCRYVDVANVGHSSVSGTYGFTDCIFVGVPQVNSLPANNAGYQRCVVVGCQTVHIKTNQGVATRDTHFDEDTNLIIGSASVPTNCNIAGSGPSKIKIGTTFYTDLAAARAAFPAMFVNCFSYSTEQCRFNNPTYLDFSLRSDSPLIGVGTDGGNITGQPRAQNFNHLHEIVAGGTKENLFIDPVSGEWFVGGESSVGVLTTLVEEAGRTRQMDDLEILGVADLVRNVPSAFNNLVNPNPLTVEMRWSMGAEDINAAPWKPFRLGIAPTRNSDGKTNGQDGYNWAENIFIQYSRRQFRITLRKNFIQQ